MERFVPAHLLDTLYAIWETNNDMIRFMIIKSLAIGIVLFAPDDDQVAAFDNFVY